MKKLLIGLLALGSLATCFASTNDCNVYIEVGSLAKNKITRAFDAAPIIETGNVYLPLGAEWLSGFLNEATQFPNGKHDDQLDPMFDAVVDTQVGINWTALGS